MDFIDRVDEQRRFRRFLNLREGALACVYGRRRIGKSRLIEEVVAGRDDVITFIAERSEAALQRSRLAADISRDGSQHRCASPEESRSSCLPAPA